MFGVDLMTGAMFFSFLNIAVLGIGAFIFGKILYIYHSNDGNIEFKDIRKYVIAGIVFAVFGAFINSGAARPKISISVPENRAVLEYQRQDNDIQIITPQPRTETLEGFRPLKQD